ncbi:MAG: hypothetical protein C0599_16990 [Salinivirgaceae bacterium]|nr:MAG: hypothetical protein C0599_16990 [Salinivirgaceae bacterium]
MISKENPNQNFFIPSYAATNMISNMKNWIVACLVVLLFFIARSSFGQAIPEHVSNDAIYEFLDELASEKVISIHSAIKPYTKQFISEKLLEAQQADSLLNKRQKKEIAFYLKAYQVWDGKYDNPYKDEKVNLLNKYSDNAAISLTHTGFVYRDSNFAAVAKPIWGTRYRTNDNGSLTHFWGGAEASATIGKHIGVWASVRDNTVSEILNWPGNFTRQDGGNYKIGLDGQNSGDYSETRGGISLGWKWGHVSLSKDHVQWGDNQHGPNIIDSRAPSFAMVKLHLKPVDWFEFDYLHGWLVSEVVDSTLSYVSQYGEDRQVFRPKNIASNMFTLHPWKYTSFSLGNSIVYSDMGGAHPAYLIPFLFYKSIDHTLNHTIQNQNSQLFLNVSIRNIKHLHLYGSMFVDEFKKDRVGNDTLHNFFSYKGGLRLQNWPIPNVSIGYEFTHTYPITYKHRIQATTYATNNYGLGHYLLDNSQEHYISLTIKPISRLRLKASYWLAFHGNEYAYDGGDRDIDAKPVLQDKTWQNKTFLLSASYEILQNVYFKLIYENTNIKGFDVDGQDAQYYLDMYTPAYYQGNQQTISFQFNIGF